LSDTPVNDPFGLHSKPHPPKQNMPKPKKHVFSSGPNKSGFKNCVHNEGKTGKMVGQG